MTSEIITGNHGSERWKRSWRTSQASPPRTSATAHTTSQTRGAARRTAPSRPATTLLVIQCWSGNVKAAPAKAQ